MYPLLKGKTVLVTGASAGFGEAIAKAFAREGARLILLARRKERLEALDKMLCDDFNTESVILQIDISDAEAVQKGLSSLLPPFAEVDVLVNNAGMVRGLEAIWQTSVEARNEIIDINVKGLLNVSAEIIKGMVARNSGHIINIGSVSGFETYQGGGVYCASKFAVRAITDTLRKELVATPIRVSHVSPGMAKTEFSLVRFSGDEARAEKVYEGFEPLAPEDVAETVLFIASRPPHVNISELTVYPTNQASVSVLHRSETS